MLARFTDRLGAASAAHCGRSLLAAAMLAGALSGCRGALAPAGGESLSVTRLKYVLDARYVVFFCDPDYYPVARGDELQRAIERFPQIVADTEKYASILEHLALAPQATPTDSVKLRIYREDKRLASIILTPTADAYAFQLREHEAKGAVYSVSGQVDGYGDIRVAARTPSYGGCPICLSGATRIATPAGEVPVRELRPGEPVWTIDAGGRRVAGSVMRVGHMRIPAGHLFVRLTLADGRALLASAGHPTADGRRLGELAVGDTLDGSRITALGRVATRDSATYDLQPDGPTAMYWANGIRLGSTLAARAASATRRP